MSISYANVVGELCPRARSGHVAIFIHGQMLIYGGICEEDRDSYYQPTDLWSYDTDTRAWTSFNTRGTSPVNGLSGSCVALIEDHMILFGGFQKDYGATSAVHILDLRNLTWQDLQGKVLGMPPSRRDKLCCWVYQRHIHFFGGYGFAAGTELSRHGEFVEECFPDGSRRGCGWNNHLYSLDCTSLDCLQWRQYRVRGDIPCPRAAHASATVGPIGYVFGGRFHQTRRNDMYSIDFRTFKWTKIIPSSGPVPEGRSWHILESIGTNYLLLFGGLSSDGRPLNDFWRFDLAAQTWNPLVNSRCECTTRIWHSSTPSDEFGEVLIFGGCTNSLLTDGPLNHCNSILIVRVSPLSLRRLCLDFIMEDVSRYRTSLPNLPKALQGLVQRRLHVTQGFMTSENTCNHTATCAIS